MRMSDKCRNNNKHNNNNSNNPLISRRTNEAGDKNKDRNATPTSTFTTSGWNTRVYNT